MSDVRMNITKQDLILFTKISPGALLQMRDFWIKRVQAFTRTGKSLFENGAKLAPLSESYVKFRKRFKGKTGEFFKPNKSNLTFTGQLIKSLKGSANVRKQSVSVFPTGQRSDGKSNKEVAQNVADNGRPFLGLDDKGVQRMTQIAIRDIRRNIKRGRRNKK